MADPFVLTPPEAKALHESFDAGFSLPTRWYTDPQIYAAELARIHRKAWHFAGHTGELAQPGDVALNSIAGVPILLVRAEDGAVNGFLNICRHRGHPVAMEAGNTRKLFCRYHGWTYGLDGALQRAPRSAEDPAFDPCELGLVRIQTHVWGPTVWVNLDLEAPPFETWIEGMPELVAQCGLDLDAFEHGFEHTWDFGSNWKIFQDNTMECYHCPTAHPELASVMEMDPAKQQWWVGGRYWAHHRIPYREGARAGVNYEKKPGEPLWYYYQWIFPTTYFQFSGKGFDIGHVILDDVEKIRMRHIFFARKGTPKEELEAGREKLAVDPTIWQDVDLCNAVQANHRSGMAPTGRVIGRSEEFVTHFLHVIVDMLGDPPAEGVRLVPPLAATG